LQSSNRIAEYRLAEFSQACRVQTGLQSLDKLAEFRQAGRAQTGRQNSDRLEEFRQT